MVNRGVGTWTYFRQIESKEPGTPVYVKSLNVALLRNMKPFQAFRNNRSLTADLSSYKKWKKRNDNGSFLRNGEMRTELLDGGSIFYRDWSWDFNLILPFGFNTRPAIKAQPVLNCWKYAKFARPTRSSAKCKMEWGTWTALKKRGIQGKTGSGSFA